jgi:hypothetical protein
MTRIAVSGHRLLTPDVAALVDGALRAELAGEDPQALVGITCLADGADQIFARVVLDRGGRLEVVVPARGYREALPAEFRAGFDELLASAAGVTVLEHEVSAAHAYLDASLTMLDGAERLVAVWDGEPARGPGGTADVVDHAHARGIPVTVIWPSGAFR